jgi:molecular chaperone DnaK (HSP70)
MIKDAETYQENDKKIKLKLIEKNKLETYIASCKRSLGNEEFRKEIGDEKLKEIASVIEDILNWCEDNESDETEFDKISADDYIVQYKHLESIILPFYESISKKKHAESGTNKKTEKIEKK